MLARRRAARRWMSDRDARALNFLDLDTRHLVNVRSVQQVAHDYAADRPHWEWEIQAHLFELSFRRFFRTWTTDVWMVNSSANVWLDESDDQPLALLSTEEVFTSGKAAMDRYAERRYALIQTVSGTPSLNKES